MITEPPERLLIHAQRAYEHAVAEPAEGRQVAEDVAAAAVRAGADEAAVVALRAAGWAAREQYDHVAARALLNRAVQTARRAALWDRLCEALITRSAVYLEMGSVGKARRDLREADARASPASRVEVDYAMALLEDTVGDHDRAADGYRRVLQQPDARPDLRFKSLNNLGLVVLRLGRYGEADQLLTEAAELAATFSPTFAGHAAESRATAAIEQGRPDEAMRHFYEAERILNRLGVHLVDLHLGRASAMLTLWLLDEAADAAARAVGHLEGRSGAPLMMGEALVLQAKIGLASSDLDGAIESATRAERLFTRQRRRGWRAQASLLRLEVQWRRGSATPAMLDGLARIERTTRELGNVPALVEASLLHGRVAAALGRRRRAGQAFDRAASAARGPALLRLRGRLAAAMRADLDGNSRRVSHVCRTGLEELADYRASFASAELRTRAAAHGTALAELGLRTALRSGRREAIWTWMERMRTVVMIQVPPPAGDAQPDVAQLRGLERDLYDLHPEDVEEQARLLRRLTQLERRVRRRMWAQQPEAATVVMPSVRRLRALRSDMVECAMLQYAVLDDAILGVVVTSRGIRFAPLGALEPIRAAGQQLAFALRRLSRPRSAAGVRAAFAAAHRELSTLDAALTAPFRDVIADADEVVVVPPAELTGVPWGGLSSLSDRAVRVVPTATMWDLTRNRHPRSDAVVLVAGPDLTAAEDEVKAIAACYDDPLVLTDGDATVDRLLAEAPAARAVHFACHGRLRRDTAAFSSLRLADGPLTVHDLERVNPSAHHWILAACDLGSPGQLVGPELDGVLATLLLGGAGGIVAGVVAVPDLETRELMTRLHDALSSGAPLAHAVQGARTGIDTSEPTGFVASIAFSCYGGG
jgi:tetratricopeptide (TPR) repeat protein